MKYCYAIDIGGTSIKYSLFDENGVAQEKWSKPTNTKGGGKSIISDIALTILDHMDEHNLEHEQILGIGLGVPGSIDESGIVIVAPNIGWRNVDACGKLSEMTGVPVYALNDANAAALGEYSQGGGKGHKSMVLITLGTGVGGGVIIDGNIVTGFAGAAGEIGHMIVNEEETIPCNCGNCGCLEQYSSATGIIRSYERLRESGKEGLLTSGTGLTAKDVFDAYWQKDLCAIEAVEKLGYYLGKACAAIACIVAPEIIVFGGGVSHAGDIILQVVQKYYDKYTYAACKDTKFALATIGNDAGIYGAAALVLSKEK